MKVEIQNGVLRNVEFEKNEDLTTLVIPDNITSIGVGAFVGCKDLTSVTIPDSVTSIGEHAFYGCSSLANITISKSVTSIDRFAFGGCSSFTNIIIPQGVTDIDDWAFSGCTGLTNITIPDGVTNIGHGTFRGCSGVTAINVDVSNANYISENGVLFNKNKTKLIQCPACKTGTLAIPDGVTNIGEYAFLGCTGLTNITIPDSVTNVDIQAFAGCSGLKDITIPDSVTNVDIQAFADCSGLKDITIPDSVTSIGSHAFAGCSGLTSIIIPDSVTSIGRYTFADCSGLTSITIPNSVTNIEYEVFANTGNGLQVCFETGTNEINMDEKTFGSSKFRFIYLSKDGKRMIFSCYEDKNLEKDSYELNFREGFPKLLNSNFSENYIQLRNWKEEKAIKFIPPDYTLTTFPSSEMKNYFVNNNNQRWGTLVKDLGFNTLEGTEKNNSLVDLMKIYYAIGGFSENQGESETAFEYVIKNVAKTSNPNATPNEVGEEIHSRFSKLSLKGEYSKTFAQFFMRYYDKNPDFMNFQLKDEDGCSSHSQDYLCNAHNSFKSLLKSYPNRVVNGNEERALLTPRFVAEHSAFVKYENVKEGNESLAETVGKYGYYQMQFDQIQRAYEEAKKIKDTYIIRADKSKEKDCISYRVLEKDDPLGFVLGDITNCCQVVGGVGETCVDDGYKNPNAGFLVFEESILDESGKQTGETRVLGQAYIWYDPKTKTVCYDNIEIPTKVLDELRKGDKKQEGISSKKLMDAVVGSAEAIMTAMNAKEVKVERVTTGEGYNDLNKELSKKFKKENKPKAQHRNYSGYTDAKRAQYIIKTYDETTKGHAEKIRNGIEVAKAYIQNMAKSIKRQRTM